MYLKPTRFLLPHICVHSEIQRLLKKAALVFMIESAMIVFVLAVKADADNKTLQSNQLSTTCLTLRQCCVSLK